MRDRRARSPQWTASQPVPCHRTLCRIDFPARRHRLHHDRYPVPLHAGHFAFGIRDFIFHVKANATSRTLVQRWLGTCRSLARRQYLRPSVRQERHDANREFHTYINKGTADTANLTLRTLVVINGGAAIAVLTFLGGLKHRDGYPRGNTPAV
jgi:hypothetical protein